MKKSSPLVHFRDDASWDALDVEGRPMREVLAAQDPAVAEALRLIYASLGEPLSVRELAKRVAISRRTIEQRFRAVLGRSPMEVIRQVSLARAAQMLRETKEPIKAIAARCGFGSPVHLSVVFRRAHGVSPSDYRRSAGVDHSMSQDHADRGEVADRRGSGCRAAGG
jgi:LacI family transcriptional regulator